MVKIFSYHHCYDDGQQVHAMQTVVGESNTDTTFFIPDSDNIRSKVLGSNVGSSRTGKFDFPDGVDNVPVFPILRSKSIDIAEVEAIERTLLKNIDDKKAQDKINLENKIEEVKKSKEVVNTSVDKGGKFSE